jgi:hypothetical protein
MVKTRKLIRNIAESVVNNKNKNESSATAQIAKMT